jgi:hypothetical protein
MKKTYKKLIMAFISIFAMPTLSKAQCISGAQYGNAIVTTSTPGTFVNASTCNFGGEYAEITFSVTGVFSFSTNVPTDYITITDDLNNVIAFGTTPLMSVNIPSVGLYYFHISASGPPACTTNNSCRVSDVFVPLLPCSGLPIAGTVPASFSICPNTSAIITATGATAASSLTYQWQQSPTSGGPWTNVTSGSGFNSTSLATVPLTSQTYYRLVVTCLISALSATSAVLSVNPNNPFTLCYCNTGLGGSGCFSDFITNVSILATPFNNSSACNTNAFGDTYSLFIPGAGTTATLNAGGSYSISINTNANNIISVWIDYNHSGTFDASEHTQVCLTSVAGTVNTAVINIPATALSGQTGLRVRSRASGNPNGPNDACTGFGSGECEDYVITINPAVPCAGAPASNSVVATNTLICNGLTSNLNLLNTYTLGGLAFQWASATSSVGPYTSIAGATLTTYSTPPLSSTTWYRCIVTCTSGPASTTATPVGITVVTTVTNTVPYFEGFEGIINDNDLPNCSWAASDPINVCQTYTTATGSWNQIPHSGSKYASFRWGTDPAGDYFYTNGIQLNAGTTYSASAFYITDGFSGWNEFSLLYGTSQSTTGLVPIASLTSGLTNTTYSALGNAFTVPTSGIYYIAVKCIGSFNPIFLTWDDLSVIGLTPCTGTPASNTVVASNTLICTGLTSNLSLATSYSTGAIAYQWASATSSVGPYTAIPSATLNTYSPGSLSTTTWYRCVITCLSGPASTTATPVGVTVVTTVTNTVPYFEGFEGITINNQLPNCSWAASNPTNICQTYISPAGSWNRIPHSGSKYAAFRWGTNPAGDYFYTNGIQLNAGTTYSASAFYITDGLNGWNEFSLLYGTSQSTTGLVPIASLTSGLTNTTYSALGNAFTVPTSGIYYIAVKCIGNGIPWFLSWDDLSVIGLPPCTGTPAANTVVATSTAVCSGASANLSLATTYTTGALTYQWASATSSVGPFTAIPGATLSTYATAGITSSSWYNCIITCLTGPASTTASPVQITVLGPPVYASVPFLENFDNTWQDRCDLRNVPVAANWDSNPTTGDDSWRRQDDGASANWTNPFFEVTPLTGAGAANFHTFDTYGNTGNLDLYVNLGGTSNYTLSLYHINTDGDDSLQVLLSTNGGGTFTPKATYYSADYSAIDGSWNKKIINLGVVNSTSCVVRFLGTTDAGFSDIGIDSLQIKTNCITPTVNLSSSSNSICIGSSAILTATGATTYSWNTGATTSTISVTPTTTTNYTVVGLVTGGCSNTKTISITATPLPTVSSVSSSTLICAGQSATLTASGATNYIWTPGNLTTSVIVVSPSSTIIYTVVGATSSCTASAIKSITVNPTPIITTTPPSVTICVAGSPATLTANGGSSYSWTPANFPGTPNAQTVVVYPTVNTIYSVASTNSLGCTGTNTVAVLIIPCTGIANKSLVGENTTVYPNPTSGQLTVLVESNSGNYTFEVFDIAGKLVYKNNLTKAESQLTIKDLTNGLYTYKITSLTTKQTVKQGKLIKE